MQRSRSWMSTVLMAAGLVLILAACTDGGGGESRSDVPSPIPTEATPRLTSEPAIRTETPSPTPASVQDALGACREAFRDAAAVSVMRDTVDDLNPAVRACSSVAEWEAAFSEFPDALDGADAELFARNRCQYGAGLSGTPLCRELSGEVTAIDARDRVIACLAAVPPSSAVDAEVAQLRRGIILFR